MTDYCRHAYGVWIEHQLRCQWSIDQGYQLWISIDTRSQMPLVHKIQETVLSIPIFFCHADFYITKPFGLALSFHFISSNLWRFKIRLLLMCVISAWLILSSQLILFHHFYNCIFKLPGGKK